MIVEKCLILNRARQIREEKKLPLREVANKIGIKYSNLARFERGESLVHSEIVFKLCDYYNVSMDYLFMRSNIKTIADNIPKPNINHLFNNEVEKEIFTLLRQIKNNTNLKMIKTFIKGLLQDELENKMQQERIDESYRQIELRQAELK